MILGKLERAGEVTTCKEQRFFEPGAVCIDLLGRHSTDARGRDLRGVWRHSRGSQDRARVSPENGLGAPLTAVERLQALRRLRPRRDPVAIVDREEYHVGSIQRERWLGEQEKRGDEERRA